ncbi:OmpA family protein [Peptostreptococcaceae bacterium AGR-M142]
MKMRKRSFIKRGSDDNFWPAFTDMISTIALIIFFLMLIAYVQNIVAGREIIAVTEEREQVEKKLRLMKTELKEIEAEVKQGEKALKLSMRKIEDQQEIIAESNEELGDLRAKLKDVAVLRVNVLDKVKKSLEKELKRSSNSDNIVTIGDNGNIILSEGLVFDYNSYELKKEGKELLNNLSKAFENVLNDSQTRSYIDTISIQGHTDDDGSPSYNRELSSRRASTVVNYLFSTNSNLQKDYGEYFVASGFSEFRPISSNPAKNRRIEIAITLKDSTIQNIIDEYLEDSKELFDENSSNQDED